MPRGGVAYTSYEAITVAGTAVGLTSGTYGQANSALIAVETASIRFRMDGTDPTASQGQEVGAGGIIELDSRDQIEKIRFIRRTGASATLRVHYGRG